MARRSLRTKTGRLKVGAIKRRIRAQEPGTVAIIDRHRVTKKLKSTGQRVRSRDGMALTWSIKHDFGALLDMKWVVHIVSLALMDHYSYSLLRGIRADGRGPLPPLSERTPHFSGRLKDTFGVRSGEMASKWVRLKVGGSFRRSSVKVKPFGGDGRSFQIDRWARRKEQPVDLQSVDGAAAVVISNAIAYAVDAMISDGTGRIGVPRNFPTSPVILPRLVG